uniref:IrrE N-terminal-like domain n=1 Tax=Siphoviridae sp. ctLNL10 TaxID=2825453 RepID=A0A8S5Q4R5_9CAUD|nr:MAG TPA: IrrE N-terminal-like domain [Siphoviridae sp. ctLNL10]
MTQTNIPLERRNEIKEVVYYTLQNYRHSNIPVEIKAIARSFSNIRLVSYSKHMKKTNLSYDDMIKFTGTNDACTDYYAKANFFIIYYNDIAKNITTSNRYRWNIAHELGHIMLGHHIAHEKTRIFRNELSYSEYDNLEEEADYFASLILVPHAALLGFQIRNANHIKVMCKISEPAAKRRYYEFVEWKSHASTLDAYDMHILHFYFNFIYKRKCKNCGTGLIQKIGKYCPICGNKNTLEWGDGDTMKYPLLRTYENGKLIQCPNCNNEETNINGDYCQICGRIIVNRCPNIECTHEVLPSNARYCPLCGSKSIFHNLDYLKDWNYEETSHFFDNFPLGIDEELPFN